ncbi:MAG TPA: hypothetical protein VFY27_09735 [Woeseiaceae bacterium]|nr:hypothetical protein [Woeseiaceae bacterium]
MSERLKGRICLFALCFLAGMAAAQQEEALEFKGSSSTTTPKFTVEAPWILDWRVFSDFPQSVSIEIALLDGTTGMHDGLVLQTKEMGNGVKLFNEGGTYQLRIDSDLARWQILVKELTKEEAEQYTPKETGFQRDSPFRRRDN